MSFTYALSIIIMYELIGCYLVVDKETSIFKMEHDLSESMKKIETLKEENTNLKLEIESRPSMREFRSLQNQNKELETKLNNRY